jgi:hypothetical protein
MTSTELFAAMSPALATEIVEYAHNTEKKLYRAALDAVAQSRKVRTVFLERQPRVQCHASVVQSLTRPPLAAAADSLLRHWLLKKHSALLIDFLDALSIKHDKGVVEELPKTVDDVALKTAVDSLLAKHPPEVVSIYLHAFNAMNAENWANLDRLIESEPSLQIKSEA